ncbi:hypothetical protein [Aquimarina sp. 2201CG14-23]|uniref:hypothetical protein n=1 Tax=Aquimarina mycalae TaxID=3040073 RepID=UPI002477F588|nr:hypothetical protein [Aquimarina sp. 2201CG14-23]MDH7444797.1 hypothetical protein [Aquimarina sp. 2201CG14-23]
MNQPIANTSNIDLKPLPSYFDEYKLKRDLILLEVAQRTDLSVDERYELFFDEIHKLTNRFFKIRVNDYKVVKITVSKGHSCTSDQPGNVKDCGWKCVVAPRPFMFIYDNQVNVVGDNKGVKIYGTKACLKMTVAGRGRNAGTIYATFKYPSVNSFFLGRFMRSIIQRDVDTLKSFLLNTDDLIEIASDIAHKVTISEMLNEVDKNEDK